MIKTFTPNDVLRYFYNETSEQEELEIKQAIIIDSDLMEVYKQLKNTVNMLEKAEKAPSQRVVDKILDYSRSMNEKSVCE